MILDSSRPEFSVHVGVRPGGGGAELTIFGELDMATAPKVKTVLDDAIAGDGEVSVDLRACGFVDSTGIAALVAAAWRLKEQGRVLRLRGAQERVRRILELTGLPSHDSIVIEPEHAARDSSAGAEGGRSGG